MEIIQEDRWIIANPYSKTSVWLICSGYIKVESIEADQLFPNDFTLYDTFCDVPIQSIVKKVV